MRTYLCFLATALIIGHLLTGCATAPATPRADANGEMRFSGVVESRRNDCHFDGICSARVAGIDVVTMSGQRVPPPVWGQPNNQPEVGQRVEVYCRATANKSCTLEGRREYSIRPMK